VSKLFSCWAVTSLSAKSKVPFDAGTFDLVVIDEASQCDIASALPLLFRAKRAVIIGDPMQLRHISALGKAKDSDLQNKYGLIENRAAWAYSVNSLYDLAAGIASDSQIVNLRDHHRSHADIIGFSNRAFYGGRLRVATRYTSLRRRSPADPGVVWQDVRGAVTRPAGTGARNILEAEAICEALRDLLIVRGYKGSVGVVTPFRSQAVCIQELVARSAELGAVAPAADLLIDTVHKFQGDERDVIFFSPVVSDGISPGALGFLRSNGNLFNVAITRARGLLHVVGDRAAAGASGVDWLEKFSEYVAGLAMARPVAPDSESQDLGPQYPAVSNPERVSDWEKILYRALYAAGIRAIPQYSVEQYDLDFAVISGERRLNVEVDGERYHRSWTGELCVRDQLRNQRLIELGWEVKRFWVYEVRDRLEEVVGSVADWMATTR
jgi:very-short-patch-repair endonuclease